jgi:hypothetical protein
MPPSLAGGSVLWDTFSMKVLFMCILLCAVFLCILCALPASSQQQPIRAITTNLQPMNIIATGNNLHVFTNRVDVNFNGIQDPGDVPASWQIFRRSTGSQSGVELSPVATPQLFPWASVNVQRLGLDTVNNILYVAINTRIASYNMLTQAVLDTAIAMWQSFPGTTSGTLPVQSISALTYSPLSRTLWVSLRAQGATRVIEVPVRPGTTTATTAIISAGIFTQQTIPFITRSNGQGLLILNEGNFGSTNSTLQMIKFDTRNTTSMRFEDTTRIISLGGTGNHLYQSGDSVFITMNGSHEVHIFDTRQERIVRTIPVGTAGFNGPRESLVIGSTLYVSTFTNDVRRFDIRTGRAISPLLIPGGRPEGLSVFAGQLFVTNAFMAGTFTSGTSIAQFDLPFVSVRPPRISATLTLVPNPVINEALCTLRADDGSMLRIVQGDIISSLGHTVGSIAFDTPFASVATARMDTRTLPAGTYFLRTTTQQGVITTPFVVVR